MKVLKNKYAVGIFTVIFCLLVKNLNAQSPAISYFTPTSTCPGTTSIVFITGSNLIGATSVTIGGRAVDSFKVNSITSITAFVSSGTTGGVVITTPEGKATSSSSFTFGNGHVPYAYVGAGGGTQDYLSVINCNSNTVTSTINLGGAPNVLCSSPDGTKVYALINSSAVDVINTATDSVIAQISVPNSPQSLCVSPDGTRLYLSNNDSTVSIVNTIADSVITILTISNTTSHYGMCLSPDGSKLYITNYNYQDSCSCFLDQTVSTINATTNTVIATVIVGKGNGALEICASPDGSKVYVVNGLDAIQNGIVSVIDASSDSVIATIPVDVNPTGICVSPDGTTVYVVNTNQAALGGSVSFINTSTNTVVADVPVNTQPDAISISPDGSKVYAANLIESYYGTVSVINTASQTVIATDTVGQFPNCSTITNVPTSCSSLPVTITNIETAEKNDAIAVDWSTTTELNTSHFIIQRSTDGSSFTDIGTVKAIGSGANSYRFTDTHPANGINYYRLESVDKDGGASYSKVVSVQLTVNSNQLTVYPNPAKEALTINGSHIASVQMIDNMGRVVKVVSLKDATNPALSVSNLPAGVYHLRIQTTDGEVSGVGFVIK